MKKLIFLLFLSVPVHATGPLYPHKDVIVKNEFENVYKEIRFIRNSPFFFATAPVNTVNVTGDGTTVDVEFDTEDYDNTDSFNTSNYTFTAPVEGFYQFSTGIEGSGFSAHTSSVLSLVTSDITIINANYETTTTRKYYVISTILHMDRGDTAKVTYIASGGAKLAEVQDNPGATSYRSYFSGFLLK